MAYVAEIHADTPSFVSGALSSKWRTNEHYNGRIPEREETLMISRDGPAPRILGTITETEMEAAVGLAARGSALDLSFLGVT